MGRVVNTTPAAVVKMEVAIETCVPDRRYLPRRISVVEPEVAHRPYNAPRGRRPRRAGLSAGRPGNRGIPMSVRLFAVVLAVCCATLAIRAADEDNPYK